MQSSSSPGHEIQKELDYYKKKLEELSGASIRYDYLLTSLRHELKQRKEAFSLLTSLQQKFTVATPLGELFSHTVKAVKTHLGMDRAVILTFDPSKKVFQPVSCIGFLAEESSTFDTLELLLPSTMLTNDSFLLLNKSSEPDEMMSRFRQLFFVNYFVGVPVFHDDNPIAYLIASRTFEKVPFNPPLNKGDVDTLIAIASLIGAVLQNKNVAELREEMKKQKDENTLISRTLAELKAMQAKLIQSEKMASLGELTAGIAHEIQNPLNFVNNFSEVNKELIDELKEELATGNIQLANEIAGNIKDNEEKILHHGRRADAIVKSMLQHSGAGTGNTEPTDLNEMIDEYARLAYHGWRAKDKTFICKLDINPGQNIGKVELVVQDISRVLLNLINNAFYAVNEKSKNSPTAVNYQPLVTISCVRKNKYVEIMVRDNGNGIPSHVIDKIFQPFYTTKPTGQGTGLGLSLSYDIVTKGHGGELKVETKEREGTEFVIVLPC